MKRAAKAIDQLVDRREDNLSADEAAYLAVLADLVEKYEDAHHAIEESSPAQMLECLIEQRGIKQKDLAAATDLPISTISELISGKRAFTMNHVERLAGYFSVRPAVFIVTRKTLEPAGSHLGLHWARCFPRG